MAIALFGIFAIAHAALGVWLWRHVRAASEPRFRCAASISLLTCLGLVYDNGLIAAGVWIGEGGVLLALSWPRFVLHAFVTPMLIYAIAEFAAVAKVGFESRAWFRWTMAVLAIALIPVGVVEDLVGLELHPACFHGTLRYASQVPADQVCGSGVPVLLPGKGPPIPSVVTVFVTIGVGVVLWLRRGWPWACVCGLLMLAGAAVPPSQVGPALGNGAEVVLMVGYAWTAARFSGEGRPTTTGEYRSR